MKTVADFQCSLISCERDIKLFKQDCALATGDYSYLKYLEYRSKAVCASIFALGVLCDVINVPVSCGLMERYKRCSRYSPTLDFQDVVWRFTSRLPLDV